MRKLKELKAIHDIFVDAINDLDVKLQDKIKKVKKEYQKNLLDEKIKLLLTICANEGLDFEKLKTKYLKESELSKVSLDDIDNSVATTIIDEELLDKIEINDVEYYYEPKEKGIIYDSDSKEVGYYKGGQFILN